MKQKSLPCFRFTHFLKFICYSFFPVSFSPSPSLSFNLFSIYLVNIILHVFYIVGTNTHQPKIIDYLHMLIISITVECERKI